MKQKKSISIIVISLIPICLAINVVGGNLASALKIPLYVDSIGTILIGMLCGPAIGCLTGALTGVVSGIFSPIMFAYIPVTAIYRLGCRLLEQEKNDDQHTETHYQRNYYCAAWRSIVVSYHRTGVRRNN